MEFASKPPRDDAWPIIWRHQAAMLMACSSLNPIESRFARLVAYALAQVPDPDGKLKIRDAQILALRKAVLADPGDEFSWNRRMELYLAPMENARKKIDYLRDIIAASTGDKSTMVPPDVRAHAAYLCASLMLQRGEDDSAKSVLTEALRDCPSSLECLTLRYQMLAPDAPVFERCGQLMDLLRANPLQPRYSSTLADLVAQSGLLQEAIPWYQLVVDTSHRLGDPARHTMLDWGAALYITDQKSDAIELNTVLLKIDPTYAPAHLLQLLLTKGSPDDYTKALQRATIALTNRVVESVNAAAPANATKATTQPLESSIPSSPPDLAPTIALIKAGVSPEVKQQFVESVADLAFLQGYFANKPDDAAKLVDALAAVVPDNTPELARLRGWNALLANKTDDAKAKFSSVASEDPLAQLGLVKVMMTSPADKTAGESLARRLLQDHPSGLLGAILWQQLSGDRVKLIPTTQADALRTALNQFPTALLTMVDHPQTMYAVSVRPKYVGTNIGESLLAEVSINNVSDYDLTIGADGVVKPELIFLLIPKLEKGPTFTSFDTVAGPTVLPSHTTSTQVVRMDQTQLLLYLNTQAAAQFEISGNLGTNQTGHGLGGYQVQFTKPFFRRNSVMNADNTPKILHDLAEGRPDQKMTALTLIRLYAHDLQANPKPAANNQGVSTTQMLINLTNAVHHARQDKLFAVSAWAAECEFEMLPPEDRAAIVSQLTDDPDWRHRQVGLLLIRGVSADVRDQIVTRLVADPQPSVRAEAVAVKAFADLPPMATTRPTTAP